MKYVLVHWSIRDGENEYDKYATVETKNAAILNNDAELFKKVLLKFYGGKKKDWKSDPTNDCQYELPHEYRTVELEEVGEIDEKTKNALQSTGVAYGLTL